MLEALKNIGRNKSAQQQTSELELLIASAREERGAIATMLTALTTRSAKLAPLGKQLEQVTDQAAGIAARLEEINKRVSSLDDRANDLQEIDKRIQALKDAARQAEQTTQKAIGPDGELRKHREAVQQLSSQALETQASLDTLKKERAALEELRGKLHGTRGQTGHDAGRHAQRRARPDPRLGDEPDTGLRQDSRDLA
jgi:DNA repair exonuclease SbcCD ATPase subunit